MSIYQRKENCPFHISVGAVVVNGEGKILTHHVTLAGTPAKFKENVGGLSEAYILMRESLEDGETLEEAVLRGVREEFGVTGKLVRYLGSIQIYIQNARPIPFEKTTLYFQVEAVEQGDRPADDEESFTELVWVEPGELLSHMKKQGLEANRPDLDESKIIEAYVKYH